MRIFIYIFLLINMLSFISPINSIILGNKLNLIKSHILSSLNKFNIKSSLKKNNFSKNSFEFQNYNYELPKKDRIIVIGDVHGDMSRLLKILYHARVINKDFKWIAKPQDTTIVQLGDQIDDLRKRNSNIKETNINKDFATIIFTDFLNKIASNNGGRFISLIGNHELLNTQGDFEYVSLKNKVNYRNALFNPGGYFSEILSNRPIVLKIGDNLFCHGGINTNHINILEDYDSNLNTINRIWSDYILNYEIDSITDKYLLNELIYDSNGILWTRNIDKNIKKILKKLDCERLFIGHTIVPEIKLEKECVWYVDTGLSKKYCKNKFQYLDIINDKVHIKTINDKKFNTKINSIEELNNEADKYYDSSIYNT